MALESKWQINECPSPELQAKIISTNGLFFLKYWPSIAVLLSRIMQMPKPAKKHHKNVFTVHNNYIYVHTIFFASIHKNHKICDIEMCHLQMQYITTLYRYLQTFLCDVLTTSVWILIFILVLNWINCVLSQTFNTRF